MQWDRIATRIASDIDRARAVERMQASARDKIDSVEYGLKSLITEIGGIMPGLRPARAVAPVLGRMPDRPEVITQPADETPIAA